MKTADVIRNLKKFTITPFTPSLKALALITCLKNVARIHSFTLPVPLLQKLTQFIRIMYCLRYAHILPADLLHALLTDSVLLEAALILCPDQYKQTFIKKILNAFGLPHNIRSFMLLMRICNALEYRLPRNITMAHVAALSRDPERVRLLLSRNAPVNALSDSGMSPLDVAIQLHGQGSTVAQLLESRGALSGQALKAQNIEKAKKYFEKQREQKQREEELIIFASIGDTAGVLRLLSLKVEINAQDEEGNTALILAARNGYYNTVVILLKKGASREITNRLRQNAYAVATAMGHHGVALLVDPVTLYDLPNMRGPHPHLEMAGPHQGGHMTHPTIFVHNDNHWQNVAFIVPLFSCSIV